MSESEHSSESGYSSPYSEIAGKETVEVECLTQRAELELCDGWSAEVELDEPARIEGDRVILPGFNGECPTCGDSSFRVEGKELMFHV